MLIMTLAEAMFQFKVRIYSIKVNPRWFSHTPRHAQFSVWHKGLQAIAPWVLLWEVPERQMHVEDSLACVSKHHPQ